jgi:hypothetical protein
MLEEMAFYAIPALPFALALLVGMLICVEIGNRIGRRHLAKGGNLKYGAAEGAVFALYGLLLAFTFSGAPARLDNRRILIADETNAIATAYARVDLVDVESQPQMRQLFRDYLDARLATYEALPDLGKAQVQYDRSKQLQRDIWLTAIADGRKPGSHPDASKLILPAINSMAEIAIKRTMGGFIHPPTVIFVLLFLLALLCATLVGFGMGMETVRSWLHIIVFAVIAVTTVFLVLEIEYPRMGMIEIGRYDNMLIDLRKSMN